MKPMPGRITVTVSGRERPGVLSPKEEAMTDERLIVVSLLRLIAETWGNAVRASEGASPDFLYAKFREDLLAAADRLAKSDD